MVSKHPGSQPPPEISHYDCAGVNFYTQKNRQRGTHWMGTLRAQIYGGAQVVCLELFIVCAESKPLLKVAFAFLCLKGVRGKSHNGGGQRAHTNSESDGESRRETRQLDEAIVIEIVQEREF